MAAGRPVRLFEYRTSDWLKHKTPSRLDGMHAAKEESLLWEAASLIAYAAESIPQKATGSGSFAPGISAKEIIISTAVVLVRRFYVVKSLKDHDHTVIAAAAMFLSCKMHNCPVMLSDCVVIMMYAAMRILKEPVFSTELSIAFGDMKRAQMERGLSDPVTKSLWEKLRDRIVPAARRGELSLLSAVGFQHLHELGWEWQVLATMRQRYKLWNAPNWDPNALERESGDTQGVSVAGSQQPAPTAASGVAGSAVGGAKAPAVAKSGQDLAKDFILDAARMSNVHCQYSPTTIAIAAVHWAFQVHSTVWRCSTPGGDKDQRIAVWDHYRQVGALSASGQLETVALDDVVAVSELVLACTRGRNRYYAQAQQQASAQAGRSRQAPASHGASQPPPQPRVSTGHTVGSAGAPPALLATGASVGSGDGRSHPSASAPAGVPPSAHEPPPPRVAAAPPPEPQRSAAEADMVKDLRAAFAKGRRPGASATAAASVDSAGAAASGRTHVTGGDGGVTDVAQSALAKNGKPTLAHDAGSLGSGETAVAGGDNGGHKRPRDDEKEEGEIESGEDVE